MATARGKSGPLGCLVGLIWLTSLVFLVTGAGTFIYSFFAHPPTSFDINASSITLSSPPGKAVEFRLTGTSVGGYWASQRGLSLSLEGHSSGFDETFAITPARPETWGNNLTVCVAGDCQNAPTSSDPFTIPVKFTLPSYLAKSGNQTLTGTLAGDIYSPQSAGGGSFENSDARLNIPVTLKLGIIHGHPKIGLLILALISLGILVATTVFAKGL